MIGAMILAAGRGERMRPLSDATPKPLLRVGGQPLIAWQLVALARAGIREVAINVSHLADRMIDEIGDGSAYGVRVRWSREVEPLETAGGIATAMPLLPEGPAIIVSGDIWSTFDYASLLPIARSMAHSASIARVHLVMVRNPDYHPRGDFMLVPGTHGQRVQAGEGPNLTYGNIGVYDTALFRELPRGVRLKLLPLLLEWIAAGRVSGERFEGPWDNVGTPADLARLDAALRARAQGDAK
jgi:N-acetyl-alpha-D-muramate 1-phosphate uridylyltransferase